MKILNIITSGLAREGITTTQYQFIKAMDSTQVEIDIAAVNYDDPDVVALFREIGCRVISLPSRAEKTSRYFCRLVHVLKKEQYDIIHVHGSSTLLTIELLAAKIAGTPVRIAHSRNTRCDYLRVHKLLRPLFDLCYTDAFACGQEAGEWLFEDKPFTVIHNGKDFSVFHFSEDKRNTMRQKYHLDSKIVLGHVGNFYEQKNHEFLVDIFYWINKENKNCFLYLMGDGPLKPAIEKKVKELGLMDAVCFAGEVHDMADRLQMMDLMIFPSLFEGLPNVVLEWQAVGLPSLIADTITAECAPSSLVEFMPLEAGAQAWAEKVCLMLSKAENRAENAMQATAALKNAGFDIEQNAKGLVDLYSELVSRRKK